MRCVDRRFQRKSIPTYEQWKSGYTMSTPWVSSLGNKEADEKS
jgi:hypothetical protein